MSIYTATPTNPHHLSVGAILTDDAGRYVVVHAAEGKRSMMTETVENLERLEHALHRGLMEELQSTGRITGYAGSTQCAVSDHRGTWQKTIVWFNVDLIHAPHWVCQETDFLVDLSDALDIDETRWPHGLVSVATQPKEQP